MAKVLVTGGLGFVGSAVCRHLCAAGRDVSVLDNGSKGRPQNLDGLPVTVHCADIRSPEDVTAVFRKVRPSVVIHLAAMHFVPECNADPVGCLEVNVIGTERILSACRHARPVRVVVTSSMAVYPIRHAANVETDCTGPCDVYGESKVMNELQAERLQRDTGIDTVAVRLSNCYGPRETNPHVIPEIMEQLKNTGNKVWLGNSDALRDFIHVDDAARGLVALALQPLSPGYHVVNVASGREYSVRQIVNQLAELLGRDIRLLRDETRCRHVDRMHLLGDVGRMRKLTGWEPSMELREGLRELCEWYGIL